MFRLRIESRPAEWRSFRWTTYLLVAGIVPMGFAAAVSAGPPFGTELILIFPLLWAMTVFGVEFTIHTSKHIQITEFDTEGIRFTGPNLIPRTFQWKNLTRVHIRAAGSRRAPTAIVFIFRERLLARFLPIDCEKTEDIAERVAGFVARYAPQVRRSGWLEALRWDPTLASDGEPSMAPRRFSPMYVAGVAFCGPLFNLYLASIALVFGFVRIPDIAWTMVAAYLLVGVDLVVYSWRTLASTGVGITASGKPAVVKALLLSGCIAAGVQLLLPLLLLR